MSLSVQVKKSKSLFSPKALRLLVIKVVVISGAESRSIKRRVATLKALKVVTREPCFWNDADGGHLGES